MKTILPILRKTLSINTLIVVLCLVIYSIGVNATVRYVKPIATGMAMGVVGKCLKLYSKHDRCLC